MPNQPHDDEIVHQVRDTTPRPGDDLRARVLKTVRPEPASSSRTVRRVWPALAAAGLVGITAAVGVSTGVVGQTLDAVAGVRGDVKHEMLQPGADQYQPGFAWGAAGRSSSTQPSMPVLVVPISGPVLRAITIPGGGGTTDRFTFRLNFAQQTDVQIFVSRGAGCRVNNRLAMTNRTAADGVRLERAPSNVLSHRVLVPRAVRFVFAIPRGRVGTRGSISVVATNPAGLVTRQCIPFRVVRRGSGSIVAVG